VSGLEKKRYLGTRCFQLPKPAPRKAILHPVYGQLVKAMPSGFFWDTLFSSQSGQGWLSSIGQSIFRQGELSAGFGCKEKTAVAHRNRARPGQRARHRRSWSSNAEARKFRPFRLLQRGISVCPCHAAQIRRSTTKIADLMCLFVRRTAQFVDLFWVPFFQRLRSLRYERLNNSVSTKNAG